MNLQINYNDKITEKYTKELLLLLKRILCMNMAYILQTLGKNSEYFIKKTTKVLVFHTQTIISFKTEFSKYRKNPQSMAR